MRGVLHIVPGAGDAANGMAVVARLLAGEQGGAEVADSCHWKSAAFEGDREVWVHGMWLPCLWLACWRTLGRGCRLIRMTHGSLSPIYLKRQSPLKKRLVAPIERYFLRRAWKVVATCEAEADWIRAFEPRAGRIEILDLKRFFRLPRGPSPVDCGRAQSMAGEDARPLHLLYLGRRHPLKGVEYLEKAAGIHNSPARPGRPGRRGAELRIVTNAAGDGKERAWDWCDALVLPSLSENFGLVVAEALERGKRVVVTDGAPAWAGECLDGPDVAGCGNACPGMRMGYSGRLICVDGYRDAPPERKPELLAEAIDLVARLRDLPRNCQ